MPIMKKLLFVILFRAATALSFAQGVAVHRVRVDLPTGDIIGAAFYEGQDTVAVQQSVVSTVNGGLAFRSHRLLTLWDVRTQTQIARREFDVNRPDTPIHPCGRVETSAALNRVYLCSAQTHIDVLDAKTLISIGALSSEVSQNIYDFGIDQARSRAFILSLHDDMSVRLAAYDLKSGARLQETTLSTAPWRGAKVAIQPRTGQVVVAVAQQSGHYDASLIRVCSLSKGLLCDEGIKVPPVGQMTFLGNELLIATQTPATDKKECIVSVDIRTKQVSPSAYCSPGTGVHFAVGVLMDKYVIGFTGTAKTHAFLEYNTSIQSSFALWRAEMPKVDAVVTDPTDYGAGQNGIRLVMGQNKPFFLAYAIRAANSLYLYLVDEDGPTAADTSLSPK